MSPASLLSCPLTVGIEEIFGELLKGGALFRHDLAVVEIALRPSSGLLQRNVVPTFACPDKDVRALRRVPASVILPALHVEYPTLF
jgi:hypothetical protein